MPNDEQENDRLDIFHFMCGLVLNGRLHLAPISQTPGRILDVGCGTDLWTIEAANEYSSAQVLGSDLSPIQLSMVPPNAKFEIDDVEEEWTYNEPFDYIHARCLSGESCHSVNLGFLVQMTQPLSSKLFLVHFAAIV